MKIIVFGLLMALTGLSLGGCASIVGEKTQTIQLDTTCNGRPIAGAKCALTNSKGSWTVTSPGSVRVHKAYDDLTAACNKDGLGATGGKFKSSAGAVWGNVLLGGAVGYAVDANTGAGFDYPPKITVEFKGRCEPVPTSPAAASSTVPYTTGGTVNPR